MLFFLTRGGARLSCETRLNPTGPGFQLAIAVNGVVRVEDFGDLPQLISREHELRLAWLAHGWRNVGAPSVRFSYARSKSR